MAEQLQDIVFTTVFAVLVLCSLVGNILVLAIVLRNSSMHKPINLLLANLAVCDALFSAFLIPRFILIHAFKHPVGQVGDYLCKFVTGGNLTWTGGAASVFTLVAIALERYYSVVYPYAIKRRFTLNKVKVTALICWFCSLLLNTPLFLVSVYSIDQDFFIESWFSLEVSKAYSMVWFVMVGISPFALMVFCYYKIIQTLWGRSHSAPVTRQILNRSRKNVTKIVLLVTFIYSVTWFPALTYYAVVAYIGDVYGLGSVIHRVNQILTAVNAASNPCIYAFQLHSFRRTVVRMFRRQQRPGPIPLTNVFTIARFRTGRAYASNETMHNPRV